MLVKKETEIKILKFSQFESGHVINEILLDKRKILIGSSPQCDLVINNPSISFYHAMLIIDENGGKIIDLESNNGIYVNNIKVSMSYFSEGDIINIGPIEFQTSEFINPNNKEIKIIDNRDKSIEIMPEKDITDTAIELPPMEGLVVIDGEYCDIRFDESNYTPLDHIPAHHVAIDDDFIDFENNIENRKIFRSNENLAIEVTTMSMGTIINIDYFPIKSGSIYASSTIQNQKTIQITNLESKDLIPLFTIKNGEIGLLALPNFKARNITKDTIIHHSLKLEQNDIISLESNSVQLMIKIVNAPPSVKLSPFFGRDINFQKQTAKIFSTFMGMMLLLLFVDINLVEPKKKKIAVIYRKAIQAPNKNMAKSTQESSLKNLDKGIKKNKQDKNPPKFSKKMKINKKQKSKSSSKTKKVTKSITTPKKLRQKPKMKAYEFKSSQSFSSLFSNDTSAAKSNIKTTKSNDSKGFESAKAQDTKGLESKESVNVSSLGKDFKGKFNSSSGAFGLASKSGIDTSFVDTKTVVLGSMDPELLRKILREYLPQFRHCYQKELQANDKLKGIIDLDFRIGISGSVSKVNINVKNARFSKPGVGCMAGVLKLIPFPKPKGGGVVDVRQPLSFFSETEKI